MDRYVIREEIVSPWSRATEMTRPCLVEIRSRVCPLVWFGTMTCYSSRVLLSSPCSLIPSASSVMSLPGIQKMINTEDCRLKERGKFIQGNTGRYRVNFRIWCSVDDGFQI